MTELVCAIIERACIDWVQGRVFIASHTPRTKTQWYTFQEWYRNLKTAYLFFTQDNMYWQASELDRQYFVDRLKVNKNERDKYEEIYEVKRRGYFALYEQGQINNN